MVGTIAAAGGSRSLAEGEAASSRKYGTVDGYDRILCTSCGGFSAEGLGKSGRLTVKFENHMLSDREWLGMSETNKGLKHHAAVLDCWNDQNGIWRTYGVARASALGNATVCRQAFGYNCVVARTARNANFVASRTAGHPARLTDRHRLHRLTTGKRPAGGR